MNENCLGKRYIGAGCESGTIQLTGTPGNALGAYLNGANIILRGNAQDATGDTMNDGDIIIHGNTGDAAGYAMRGGRIFVKGNAGYRAGIHMKEYREKKPVMVIGNRCGSFLGEYQAGGVIVVLGLECEGECPVGNFCATGMYGGKIFIRTDKIPPDISDKITVSVATREQLGEIVPQLVKFCQEFGGDLEKIIEKNFFLLTPDTKNPYKQLYIYN